MISGLFLGFGDWLVYVEIDGLFCDFGYLLFGFWGVECFWFGVCFVGDDVGVYWFDEGVS